MFLRLFEGPPRPLPRQSPRHATVPDPLSGQCPDYRPACVPAERCTDCIALAQPDCSHCQHRCDDRPANTTRTPVRWMHIPKTGSTFGLTVIRHACHDVLPAWHTMYMALRGGRLDVRLARAVGARRAERGSRCGGRLLLPLVGHLALRPQERGVVAMFRRPTQRLISAFLDNYHAWGLPGEERRAMKAASRTVASWARYPGVEGCMAKMLAGRDCASRIGAGERQAVLRAALQALPSLTYVGIVERWDASVRAPAAPRRH